MKHTLVQLDIAVLRLINDRSGNSFFDQVMLVLSDAYFWIAVSVVIILLCLWKRRFDVIRKLVVVGICIGLSDQISFEIVKQIVKRERPCWVLPNVHVNEGHCGGSYGFTSNHAANAGAVAFLAWSFFGAQVGFIAWGLAGLVGISRVYLGVHYPLDVVGGYMLGAGIAWIVLRMLNWMKIRI